MIRARTKMTKVKKLYQVLNEKGAGVYDYIQDLLQLIDHQQANSATVKRPYLVLRTCLGRSSMVFFFGMQPVQLRTSGP